MSLKLFGDLLNKSVALRAEHVPFRFDNLTAIPVHGEHMFAFEGMDRAFKFTPAGLWFLTYRLSDQLTDQEKNHMVALWEQSKTDPQPFVDMVNEYRAYQICAGDVREDYLITLIGDQCWSILTNYNPLPNEKILTWVADNNLHSNLLWGEVGPEAAHFYLSLNTEDDIHVGLHIVNGETGRTAFSYYAFVRSDNYTFDWPVHAKRRHLSLLGDAQENLLIALEEIKQLKVYDAMRRVQLREVTGLTALKNYDKIETLLTPSMNVVQMFSMLSEYQNKHGYKMVVKAALDLAMQEVEKELAR